MIGFIDSGVGGLNVLISCAKLFNDDFVFLCDNKNSPYGNKNKKKLLEITKRNIDFLLKNYKPSAVVIACNTLSFSIGEEIKNYYNIPIILMEINLIKLNNYKKDYLFFGTKNTIKNNLQINNKIKTEKCCKSLVIRDLPNFIDNNLFNKNIIKNYLLENIKIDNYKNIKTIILCCTHYKTIKKELLEIFGNVDFFEYEEDVAKRVKDFSRNNKKRSFKILLTEKDNSLYNNMRKYLFNNLHNKRDV